MIGSGERSFKSWHMIAVVLGLFAAGAVPLLLANQGDDPTSQSSQAASVRPREQPPGPVKSEDLETENVSSLPLEQPIAASSWPSSDSLGCPSTDLRVLVIAADGKEPTLPAIRQVLDYLGTPYTVYVANQNPGGLTPNKLSEGCRAFYQGVILTTGDLAYDPDGAGVGGTTSAFSDAEWQTLREYEANFGVRRVAWFAYPTPEYGLQNPQSVDTSETPIEASYTDAGRDVFSDANSDNPLVVADAFAYPAELADEATTPLLTDEEGRILAATAERPDGRETLALTFNSNQYMTHNLVLDSALVGWVTRGLFLGEERVNLSAQIDDFFLPNAIYRTTDRYRMTDEDLRAVIDWQEPVRERPTVERLRLDQAFNAYGTTGVYDSKDTLTPAAEANKEEFTWVSHTYSHLDWDELDYETALTELRDNNAYARRLDLEEYEEVNLVTPEYSGLENPEAMRAARDAGVRFVVGDNSKPEYDNPSPNAGLPHPLQPSILIIPRYPNNLGFDVSTPEEWTRQYNDRYRDTWRQNLSYEEVLDKESDVLLSYLLKGDIDPWMFHQANLRAYDGERTLLGDLLDRTLQQFSGKLIS
ncbi:MAG: hypothetical protein M3P49_16440 [Actinomycetota bacterium]|nr:hypothetical protein [Actinomycetota bacterium]